MKSVGKTLRKNLSILEVKGLDEYQKGLKLQAIYFKPEPAALKKAKSFRSLYHGSVSHGFCKYCSNRLQKGCLTALLLGTIKNWNGCQNQKRIVQSSS